MAVPYQHLQIEKKEQVRQMFNNIAPKYDLLNNVLSAGVDKIWRKNAINELAKNHPKKILDVATGTGDFAIAALRINPESIVGIDISAGMLEKGNEKIKRLQLENKIELKEADSENLPFAENSFDACTVAFGVRNFGNLQKALEEKNMTPISAELEWIPTTTVPVTDAQAEDVSKLIEKLEQDEDVQKVYHNLK